MGNASGRLGECLGNASGRLGETYIGRLVLSMLGLSGEAWGGLGRLGECLGILRGGLVGLGECFGEAWGIY